MGLAASQARFLAITSRKKNCEFRSMQIAQEKLSVTRDLQRAAVEYQNSLSATKLVWEAEDQSLYDLSYGLMMTPSALNEFDSYLLTDAQGKVLLSKNIFESLKNNSILNADGSCRLSRNQNDFELFLQAMGQAGAINTRNISQYYDPLAGLGGNIKDKGVANAYTYNQYVNYMKEATFDVPGKAVWSYNDETKKWAFELDGANNKSQYTIGDKIYALKLSDLGIDFKQDSSGKGTSISANGDNVSGAVVITKGTSTLSKSQVEKLTVGDLLSGQYVMSAKANGDNMEKLALKVLEQVARLFGYGYPGNVENAADYPEGYGLNVDSKSAQALDFAYEFTKWAVIEKVDKDLHKLTSVADEARKTNGIVYSTKEHGLSAISLTNMVKSLLTNFVIGIEGFDCGLDVKRGENSAKNSTYISGTSDYLFLTSNDVAVTDTNQLNADYYSQLFNQICANGCSSDGIKMDKVTDIEYLNYALKNGQLFVSCMNEDGYFYQAHYAANGHISEVQDEDAIVQAELDYEITKSKLNFKEESLDLKMKNIDTELSALSTEYDTVKGLIGKNIEKVFQMFQ